MPHCFVGFLVCSDTHADFEGVHQTRHDQKQERPEPCDLPDAEPTGKANCTGQPYAGAGREPLN